MGKANTYKRFQHLEMWLGLSIRLTDRRYELGGAFSLLAVLGSWVFASKKGLATIFTTCEENYAKLVIKIFFFN